MKKFTKYLVWLCICWGVIHLLYMTVDGLSDDGQTADVAIVLGSQVNKDGTLSDRLKARVDQSIVLYRQHRVKKIIVSGRAGVFEQANKMKEYLLSQNIPESDIIADNLGSSTEKTVENSLAIMEALGYHSAICVTQYFHQTRTKMLFRKAGFANITSSSPVFFEGLDFYSVPREFVAFYVTLLK